MDKLAQKILVYRLGSLGDTIIALPCFHKVKECFPDADITLLTNRPVAAKASSIEAILGHDYFYNRVISYPVGTRNIFTIVSIIKQIRLLKIDTVINLSATRSKSSLRRDWCFFKAAGVKNLIGFSISNEDFRIEFDIETKLYEWEAKRLSNQIKVLGPINLNDERNWDLRLTTNEIKSAEQVLDKNLYTYPIIAISIGTKCQSNNWELDNWLRLLKKAKHFLPGWKLVVLGATEEYALSDQLVKAWEGEALNLCGKISPRISAAVLKYVSVFVGHDSGPMHLAACVGTPSVGIFSARNLPGRWYPRGSKNQIVYHQTECAGCGLEECIVQKKRCILTITTDEVKDAIIKVIPAELQVKIRV